MEAKLSSISFDFSSAPNFDVCILSVRKTSGDGKITILTDNDSINEQILTKTKKNIYVNLGNSRKLEIQRPQTSIGIIDILGIELYISSTIEGSQVTDWKKILRRCKSYKNIRVDSGKLYASEGAIIIADGIETVSTQPQNFFKIQDNIIKFLSSCEITDLQINGEQKQAQQIFPHVGPPPQQIIQLTENQSAEDNTINSVAPITDETTDETISSNVLYSGSAKSLAQLAGSKDIKFNGKSIIMERSGKITIPLSNMSPNTTYTVVIEAGKVLGNGKIIAYVSPQHVDNTVYFASELHKPIQINVRSGVAQDNLFKLIIERPDSSTGSVAISRVLVIDNSIIPDTYQIAYQNTKIQHNIGDIKLHSEKFAITQEQPAPQFPHIRVLYLPLGHQPGMADAFRNIGVQLQVFDFYSLWQNTHNKNAIAEEFLQNVRIFRPHLIHTQLQFTGLLDANTIHEARKISPGVIITNWSGDVRQNAVPEFVRIANAFDHAFISSTGQLDLYKRAGCNTIAYWQIGYDPKFNYPLYKDNFKYDASFLGNNYGNVFPEGKLRYNVATQLRNTLGEKFGLFGTGYNPPARSVAPKDANIVYNDSACVISISHFNNVSHYFSDRLLHCIASGRPTISWFFPGIDDYFKEDEEIFIARNVNDVLDIIQYCKTHVEEASKVGVNGYNKVIKEHTFTSRALELLNLVGLT
jgi:hypothetical protein